MVSTNGLSNWVTVDLGAVAANLARLAELTRRPVMAVVKANGYGHGLAEVGRAAAAAGAHSLGVARLEEGLALRAAGVTIPILVMGGIADGRWEEAVAAELQIAIWTGDHLSLAAAAARRRNAPARVQLKVDTGMTRLGADPATAYEVASHLAAMDGVWFEGAFTHLARADEIDPAPTGAQLSLWQDFVGRLEAKRIRPPLLHVANTAGAVAHPDARWDLVRSGVGVLGLNPSAQVPLPQGFRPALSWTARLTSVREVPAGTGVSYGHAYVTRGTERIGVVPVGYGDGYRRIDGNTVLIGGRRAPVVGRVCMDQVIVQLDGVPGARRGDEVVLLGSQGEESISADQLAATWRTIPYEVVCGIAARVPRMYAG